jgi:hypothetical protein
MTTPEAAPRHIPPRRRRLRHFLLQLLPVTAGILIALLVVGAVDLARSRALVGAAREAIALEIAENARALENRATSFAVMQDELANVSALVDDILNRGRSDIDSYSYTLDLPRLTRASWDSADRTGALAHMDYAEVRRYAELYARQQLVEDAQRGFLARLPAFGVIRQAMESGDPEGYAQDLQARRAEIAGFREALVLYIDLADQLAMHYQEIQGSSE